jgi:hypothetical protein
MIRLAIINQDGKMVSPEDLSTATELQQAADQARMLIRQCERLAAAKSKGGGPPVAGKVPYA